MCKFHVLIIVLWSVFFTACAAKVSTTSEPPVPALIAAPEQSMRASLSPTKTSAKAMTIADVLELSKVRSARLTRDGQSLVYLKSQLDWRGNRWVNQVWRYQEATGKSRQLTFGRNSVSNLVLSPDDQQIAFFTRRDKDKSRQLYVMHLDGGEAYPLSKLEVSPNNLTWSPDGQHLYFTAQPSLSKEQQKARKNKAIIKAFEDPNDKYALWRISLASGKVEQLTQANRSIVYYQLANDSQTVLLSKAPGKLLDQRHQAELWLLNLADKSERRLTYNHYFERNGRLSADGKLVIYTATVNDQQEQYHNSKLFVLDVEQQTTRLLSQNFIGEIEDIEWAATANHVLFVANIGVSSHLHQVNMSTNEITQLTFGDWTIDDWFYQPSLDRHIIEKRSATEPGDFWQLASREHSFADVQPSVKLKRLTGHYQNIAQQFLLPEQKKISWSSHDGQSIEGLLTFPLNYRAGNAFPLVVQTHGGPRSSDQFGLWSTSDYLPVLAAHGYGILMVNHRGSTGYGDEFLRDMVGGYFRNAHLDVLSGVDFLIEEGLAAPEKLVKMGWSAGGHMTNKMITFTDRFKVASSGAGAVDWLSMYGETDAAYMRTWWFGGKPWEQNAPIATYRQNSVVNELWKVKTPTLIFVGEKDVRVPSTQSKLLFRGLRDNGVDTELYIAKGEPHGFRKPKNRLFKINKELEWFDRYIFNKTYSHEPIPKRH
ncbi:S9 family peptidase [Thalassotalea euphylliae]|uniref:S9 family peptidase n=1 Tax=Thalassotalea euphylliae TaxID=1655234 RepID=A0A3E0TMA3_9GAMM|nr:S9 family peptidase [Thalassotalea euphylliae]REL25681.1 S9 family peptidase [Thalassotalea euphylliae]